VEQDRPLTKEQLAHRRNQLAMLHVSNIQRAYREAWKACSMDGDQPPKPAAIQDLVQVWRVLWGWGKK
jgi:hypothetical protein